MNDSYQAIYDATRSRIGSVDGQALMQEIVSRFDISFAVNILKDDFLSVAHEFQRPAVLYKPSLFMDGDQWCALYGENLQDGVAGFGDSPEKAMEDFDKEWKKSAVRAKLKK